MRWHRRGALVLRKVRARLPLKVLRGNPGQRRLRPEPMPARGEAVPEPPKYLTDYAVEEWSRTAPELWHLGLLTVLDTNLFAAYCQSYAKWRLAERRSSGWSTAIR
jgi:phage terminase small subunit